jgi:hypothetical protein
MTRTIAVAIALATVLMSTAAYATDPSPRGDEGQQAPRGQDVQAPRDRQDEIQAPRGQDLNAPRGSTVVSPR